MSKPSVSVRIASVISTWFGCGFSPIAPGTAGSAAALVIAFALGWPPWWFAVLAAAILPLGIWSADVEAKTSGRKDPGHIVVDEVAGQWITLAAAGTLNWKTGLTAFLLFRLLDIVKPAPARQFEALPGGIGIMADDVMAGIYGAVILALLTHWINF
jgi:phosphatidylglycerophosphatase A